MHARNLAEDGGDDACLYFPSPFLVSTHGRQPRANLRLGGPQPAPPPLRTSRLESRYAFHRLSRFLSLSRVFLGFVWEFSWLKYGVLRGVEQHSCGSVRTEGRIGSTTGCRSSFPIKIPWTFVSGSLSLSLSSSFVFSFFQFIKILLQEFHRLFMESRFVLLFV